MCHASCRVPCPLQFKQTPLHQAAETGHRPVLQYLLDNNAMLGFRDRDGRTPQEAAAKYGNDSIVTFLNEQVYSVHACVCVRARACVCV